MNEINWDYIRHGLCLIGSIEALCYATKALSYLYEPFLHETSDPAEKKALHKILFLPTPLDFHFYYKLEREYKEQNKSKEPKTKENFQM